MIAGSDEAGKGDYFGYLVVACVCGDEYLLKELKVRDSKTLSDTQIFRLEREIKKVCTPSVIAISPERYNQLHKDSGGKYNLNQILGWLHAKAISEVLHTCRPKRVIVDKFGKEENVLVNLSPDFRGKIIFLTKGEADPAVAAASIIARAEFLRKHTYLSKKFGLELPLGATLVKDSAREFIKLHGKQELNKVAKIHFKTTEEL